MRAIWWYAFGAGLALVALVVAGVLVFAGDGGDANGSVIGECQPAPRSGPAGNADVTERVAGKGFNRTIVIRAKDKQTGVPLRGAKVLIRAEMTCPHFMPLYEKRLPEVTRGTYKGPYTLIMPGDWKFVIVVTSKQGGTTTASFPLKIVG